MAWSDISGSANRWVSRGNLLDAITYGYFSWGGTTIPNDARFFRKDQLSGYITNNNTSLYSGKAANQLIKVSELAVSSSGNSEIIYGLSLIHAFDLQGFSSYSNACSTGSTAYYTTIYWTGTLAVNTRLSTAAWYISNFENDSPYCFYYTSSGWVEIGKDSNGYYIYDIGNCTTTTTTTTAAPTYDYYLATSYTCSGCTVEATNVNVCFPAGTSYLSTKYYITSGTPTHTYKITSATSYAISIILLSTGFTTCTIACSVAP